MSHALDPYIDQLIPTTKLSCSDADPYTGDTHGWSLRRPVVRKSSSSSALSHTYMCMYSPYRNGMSRLSTQDTRTILQLNSVPPLGRLGDAAATGGNEEEVKRGTALLNTQSKKERYRKTPRLYHNSQASKSECNRYVCTDMTELLWKVASFNACNGKQAYLSAEFLLGPFVCLLCFVYLTGCV